MSNLELVILEHSSEPEWPPNVPIPEGAVFHPGTAWTVDYFFTPTFIDLFLEDAQTSSELSSQMVSELAWEFSCSRSVSYRKGELPLYQLPTRRSSIPRRFVEVTDREIVYLSYRLARGSITSSMMSSSIASV